MEKLLHRSTLLVDSDVVIFLRRPAPHGGDPSAAARLEPNPVLSVIDAVVACVRHEDCAFLKIQSALDDTSVVCHSSPSRRDTGWAAVCAV